MNITEIKGGVTAAKGFEAAAAAAAIKYQGRTDMALVYSEKPCHAAGTFTTNLVKAAPVKWDQKIVKESPYAQAVIVNSGIANACTGEEGMGYCKETAEEAAKVLGVPENAVLVASTGVIGMQLPMDRLKKGISLLKEAKGSTLEHGTAASKAIMTTDTVNKEIAVQVELGGKTVTVGGMCKGSGMIHPNMCTMLAFVTTDTNISKEMLQKCAHAFLQHFQRNAAEMRERRRKRYLQHDFRGRGHFHQRHPAGAGQRHGREPGDYGRKRGLQGVCKGTEYSQHLACKKDGRRR